MSSTNSAAPVRPLDDYDMLYHRCNNSLDARVRNGNCYCGEMSSVRSSR